MGAVTPLRETPAVFRILAGFQAGIMGVLALLVWLSLTAVWYRRPVWSAANLMATFFYGDRALISGFRFSTLSGVAFYLLLYSLLGVVFGISAGRLGSRLHVVLAGLLFGLAWYYLAFGVLWQRLNPLLTLYTHSEPMLSGHLLWGLWLGRVPVYLRLLTARAAHPPDASDSM